MPSKRHEPLRTCVVCRSKRGKSELIRFVRTPQGTVAWDKAKILPGRGAYLCPSRICMENVIKRKGFERAFKKKVDASNLVSGLDSGSFVDAKDQSV